MIPSPRSVRVPLSRRVEHEGDDRRAGRLRCGDCSLIECRGEFFRGRVDGGSLDLIGCGGLKTELADAIAFAGSDRRPEDAAGLGAGGGRMAMVGVGGGWG